MYFSFLLWASISAALKPGLSSSNVLCFIAIVAIVSFKQIRNSGVLSFYCILFTKFSFSLSRLYAYPYYMCNLINLAQQKEAVIK